MRVKYSKLQLGPSFFSPFLSDASLDATGLLLTANVASSGNAPIMPITGVTGFTVKVDSVGVSLASAVRAGSASILITLATPVLLHASVVTLSYSPGNVTDSKGTALQAKTDLSVTNNVP